MKTAVAKIYIDKVNRLAKDFAKARAATFPLKCQKRVLGSTEQVYKEIALFLYIRVNKITYNREKFCYNEIKSKTLKTFSCKLYHKILLDMQKHHVIAINNHYWHGTKDDSFPKSFLMHFDIVKKINETKLRFEYDLTVVDVPAKVSRLLGLDVQDELSKDPELDETKNKLNRFKWREPIKEKMVVEEYPCLNFYRQLSYSERSLESFCHGDDVLYTIYKRKLSKLNKPPALVKGRLYHVFHSFTKKFREKVLRLDGEKIKEIFDIRGADNYALAYHFEHTFTEPRVSDADMLAFQEFTRRDLRRWFGKTKLWRCTKKVKKYFKVYYNSKPEFYKNIWKGSLMKEIDNFFWTHFPTVRKFIQAHDDIWQICFNREFELMSDKMVKRCWYERGVKSLTCHDSLYVKLSDIEKMYDVRHFFVETVDFQWDRAKLMLSL